MLKNVIGLMSGTSMDGVDAAYLKTNGIDFIETGMAITLPYSDSFRNELSEVVSKGLYSKNVEYQITNIHADAVKHLIEKNGDSRGFVDLIGFSGHTIFHIPDEKKTLQIGDGAMLADLTGINVVSDFRINDIKNISLPYSPWQSLLESSFPGFLRFFCLRGHGTSLFLAKFLFLFVSVVVVP